MLYRSHLKTSTFCCRGLVASFSFRLFFFLFFSVAFYATRIDKNTGTYPFSIALQSSILRYKVFRNYSVREKDYWLLFLDSKMWKYGIWIFGEDFEKIDLKWWRILNNFILNFKLIFGIINDDIYLICFDQNYKFLFPLFNYINIKKYFKGKR